MSPSTADPRDGSPYAFYEMQGGGFGGRATGHGVDGVHVHMSNAMNTPAEVLETAYPLRVERYELRPDSGGAGRFRGDSVSGGTSASATTPRRSASSPTASDTRPTDCSAAATASAARCSCATRAASATRTGPLTTRRLATPAG
jgi:N-methylhydantoinase B/oxoprolinase/acetone carboxylase alpha subunit